MFNRNNWYWSSLAFIISLIKSASACGFSKPTFIAEGKENGIQVLYKDETIWATQKTMAELFGVDRTVITKHLKNIFDSLELEQELVCAKFAHTAEDGKTYNTAFYNLDAIISVGYRVNSIRATQFRQWCTYVLRQFAIRGYVIDKKRMENGSFIGEDYFEHLLAEIREIRLSERRFYQKLTDRCRTKCTMRYMDIRQRN